MAAASHTISGPAGAATMASIDSSPAPTTAGLVLAAGGGTRFGGPKALARDRGGTSWLLRAVGALAQSGCEPVLVVLGAAADEAEVLLAGCAGVQIVRATDWATGLSASLRAGLGAAAKLVPAPTALVVVPVDVPDLTVNVVVRVLGGPAGAGQVGLSTLRQALFDGRPGHPVVIGRSHWAPLTAQLTGDTGARAYLVAHHVRAIECGDLGTGEDADRQLPE